MVTVSATPGPITPSAVAKTPKKAITLPKAEKTIAKAESAAPKAEIATCKPEITAPKAVPKVEPETQKAKIATLKAKVDALGAKPINTEPKQVEPKLVDADTPPERPSQDLPDVSSLAQSFDLLSLDGPKLAKAREALTKVPAGKVTPKPIKLSDKPPAASATRVDSPIAAGPSKLSEEEETQFTMVLDDVLVCEGRSTKEPEPLDLSLAYPKEGIAEDGTVRGGALFLLAIIMSTPRIVDASLGH